MKTVQRYIPLTSRRERTATTNSTRGGFSRRKKRKAYMRETSMPARRLGKHPNAKIYRGRRVILVFAIGLTLAFAAKIVLSFFDAEHISFQLSGNLHYTEVQIYDILAEQLDNIVTDSEKQTETYLKENLSYIKEVSVSKRVMKRLLTIEITEREPFVLLKFYNGFKNPPVPGTVADQECSLFLLDVEAHVLEAIDVGETGLPVDQRFRKMAVIFAAGDRPPKVGASVQISEVPLAVEILKIASLQQPRFATQIETIDASRSKQVKIQIQALPLPVWIAGDAIETGLHHVTLLLKQHKVHMSELLKVSPNVTQPYLDARFEDSIYLGGYAEAK